MKREFGSRLIEDFFSKRDLRLVVDTSGAFIPGHGTPTVILVECPQSPSSSTVKAVLGVRGEPGQPDDPAKGLVWTSIVENIDRTDFDNEYVSVTDLPRTVLDTAVPFVGTGARWPWHDFPLRGVWSCMRYGRGGGLTPAGQRSRERVRMQAAAWFERGESISWVARGLQVSVRRVEKWRSAWRTGGSAALRSAGPQSAPRLSGRQFTRLESELRRGPAAHGWDVDQRWTLTRVVTLTRRLFRISYSVSGMSALLRRNGWSVQVPARRAIERDDEAIEVWKDQVWPQVKTTAAARNAWICFEDESGQGLRPPKGRTWGRRGLTPVVRVRGGGTGRVNIAGLVCYRPGDRSRLIYKVRVWRGRKGEAKSLTWADYRDLLVSAHQQLGAPIVLVWDNLSTHKMPPMRAFIDAHADWLTVVHLPTYAPDLNPAEGIWSMLKGSLTNFAATNLNHLVRAVKRRLKMIQYQSHLVDGCLTQTGLIMEPP